MRYIILLMSTLFCLTGCHVYTNYYTDYTLITEFAQTKYLYTEKLNLENLYLLGNDNSIVYIEEYMIEDFNSRKIGIQTVIVNYNKVSFYYDIEVAFNYI